MHLQYCYPIVLLEAVSHSPPLILLNCQTAPLLLIFFSVTAFMAKIIGRSVLAISFFFFFFYHNVKSYKTALNDICGQQLSRQGDAACTADFTDG